MVEAVLALAVPITGAVEFIRTLLLRIPIFSAAEPIAQSIVLQAIAFVLGVLAAVVANVNMFTSVPALAALPNEWGIVFTGLIASTGSTAIHVILAFFSEREAQPMPITSQTVWVKKRFLPLV